MRWHLEVVIESTEVGIYPLFNKNQVVGTGVLLRSD